MPLFPGASAVFNRPQKRLDYRTTRLRRPLSAPFVKGASASTTSRPAFRDDRERPSRRVGTAQAGSADLPDRESEIFFS
jgi:hypothetical protein